MSRAGRVLVRPASPREGRPSGSGCAFRWLSRSGEDTRSRCWRLTRSCRVAGALVFFLLPRAAAAAAWSPSASSPLPSPSQDGCCPDGASCRRRVLHPAAVEHRGVPDVGERRRRRGAVQHRAHAPELEALALRPRLRLVLLQARDQTIRTRGIQRASHGQTKTTTGDTQGRARERESVATMDEGHVRGVTASGTQSATSNC